MCLGPCSFLLLPRVPTHSLMHPPPSHVAGASQAQYVSHGPQDISLLPPRVEKGLEFDLLPSLQKLGVF